MLKNILLKQKNLLITTGICLAASAASTLPSHAMEIQWDKEGWQIGIGPRNGPRPLNIPDYFPEPNLSVPEDFNSKTYYALNPEFNHEFAAEQARNAGLNYPAGSDLLGKWHYANYGRAEGRLYMPIDFNAATYYALNPDFKHEFAAKQAKKAGLKLKQGSDELGRWHYAHFGRAEGRHYIPADFNAAVYYAINQDFNHEFAANQARHAGLNLPAGSDPLGKWHYAHFGRAEGRRYQ